MSHKPIPIKTQELTSDHKSRQSNTFLGRLKEAAAGAFTCAMNGVEKAMDVAFQAAHFVARHGANIAVAAARDFAKMPVGDLLSDELKAAWRTFKQNRRPLRIRLLRTACVAAVLAVAVGVYNSVDVQMVYAVYMNGELIGYQEQAGDAEAILVESEKAAEKGYGRDLTVLYVNDIAGEEAGLYDLEGRDGQGNYSYEQCEVVYEEVLKEKGMELLSAEALSARILPRLTFMESAVAVRVDGETLAYMETEEEALAALNTYLSGYTGKLENATTVSISTVEKLDVDWTFVKEDTPIVDGTGLLSLFSNTSGLQVYTAHKGETLYTIASETGTGIAALEEMNPQLSEESLTESTLVLLPRQPRVSVRTVETVTYNEVVEYEFEYIDDDTLPAGTVLIEQKGENGLRIVTEEIVSINGEIVSTQIVNEDDALSPVNFILRRGTDTENSRITGSVPMGTGMFIWPTSATWISSPYGSRHGENHTGTDIAGQMYDVIWAAAGGTVTFAQDDDGYGLAIVIEHENGYKTRYAHNAKLLVEEGQVVEQGEAIALLGSTGRSTGPHLHFEVIRDGQHYNPMGFFER